MGGILLQFLLECVNAEKAQSQWSSRNVVELVASVEDERCSTERALSLCARHYSKVYQNPELQRIQQILIFMR